MGILYKVPAELSCSVIMAAFIGAIIGGPPLAIVLSGLVGLSIGVYLFGKKKKRDEWTEYVLWAKREAAKFRA